MSADWWFYCPKCKETHHDSFCDWRGTIPNITAHCWNCGTELTVIHEYHERKSPRRKRKDGEA